MPGWVRGQISHRGFDNYRMRTYRTIEFEGRLVTQTELAQLLKTTQKRVSRLLKSGLAANEMAAVIVADRAKMHPLIPFQGRHVPDKRARTHDRSFARRDPERPEQRPDRG